MNLHPQFWTQGLRWLTLRMRSLAYALRWRRWVRWSVGIVFFLVIALSVLGAIEWRVTAFEGRIQAALTSANSDLAYEAEDMFVQIIPWQGQVRIRLSRAQISYAPLLQEPLDLRDVRLNLPIHRALRGDYRPTGVSIAGGSLALKVPAEVFELDPQVKSQQTTEEIWGFVFDTDALALIEAALPAQIFAEVNIQALDLQFLDSEGFTPLFDLRIDQARAHDRFVLPRGAQPRVATVRGHIRAPGAAAVPFVLDAELQKGARLTLEAHTGELVPANYYNTLRKAGFTTPERLTTPYELGASLSLDRSSGIYVGGIEIFEVQDAQSALVAVAEVSADRRTQVLDLTSELAGLNLRSLAPWTPVPQFLEKADLATQGTLTFTWNRQTGDWLGEFEVTEGSGTLALPTIGLPAQPGAIIGVRNVQAHGAFGPRGFIFRDIQVATGTPTQAGPTLDAALVIRTGPAGSLMTLDLRSQALNQGDLFFLWPTSVATRVRNQIEDVVTAGAFSDLSFTGVYNLVNQDDGTTLFALEGQQLSAGFETARVQLTPHLPPLTQAHGRLDLRGGILNVAVNQANFGSMVLTNGQTRLDFSQPDRLELRVESPMAGPLAPALAILADGELGLEGLADLPLEDLQAQAEGQLGFVLAFNPRLVEAQGMPREGIHVDTQLEISDLQVQNYLFGAGVQAGTLSLQIDDDGLRGAGQIRLDDLEGSVEVRQTFAADRPSVLDVSVVTQVPAAKVARFIPGLEVFLDGTAQGNFLYRAEAGQAAVLSVNLDLENTAIDFPLLVYEKSAGEPGALTLALEFEDQTAVLARDIVLTGPDLNASGQIRLAPESWQTIDVRNAEVGNSRLTNLGIENRGDFLWATVAGGELDMESLLAQFRQSSATRGDAGTPSAALGFGLARPLVIEDAQFDRLIFGTDARLDAVQTSVVIGNDGLRGFTLNADVPANEGERPGGQLTSRLVQRDGAYVLRLEAENFGALVQALDMSDHVRGGQFTLSGQSQFPLGGGPWSLAGEGSDLNVLELPSLLEVASLISLTGVLEQMSGRGLNISELAFRGDLDTQSLELRALRIAGPSLGLNLQGVFNWATQRLDVRGALAPFNLVNLVAEDIPVIRELFTGTDGQGLFASQFEITGPFSDPNFEVDALSILQPGILRSFVDELEEGL